MSNATTAAASFDHRLQVGSRTQKIIADLLQREAVPVRTELTAVARHVFSESPVDYRPRESLLEAATAAGVYVNRFRPLDGWTFAGSESCYGSCRFDLVWTHNRHGHLIDEVKLGIGRGGELAVRDQIDRYLEVGCEIWPDFIGVRLCAVHEPAASRLYVPLQRQSSLVSASDLASELAPR